MKPSSDHPLDNPAWHALTGPHAHLAIGCGKARHYPRDIVPFSAIEDATPEAYRDLAVDLRPDAEARLHRLTDEPVPAQWEKVAAHSLLQMLADDVMTDGSNTHAVVTLGDADLQAMLDLMLATNPGRFGLRTPMLGTYLGIREEGRLVAMAGERMRVAGYVELSAISTHPGARRRGYAGRLTLELMRRAFDRGERPFLLVRSTNTGAIALYRKLGFKARREFVSLWCKPFRATS